MSAETGHHGFPSELSSSTSQSESDEEPYETEDAHPRGFYSGSFFHPQRTTQVVFEYQAGRRVARLRSPRDLYGVSSASFFQLPRWPNECQVLNGRVHHIDWEPPFPEPMYRSKGLEEEPPCLDPIEGRVVYQVEKGWPESCFMCSRVGGTRSPLRAEFPHNEEDLGSTLLFESRFESGNLQKAVQVREYEYQLTLHTDLYTSRHTQWYYFQVKNTRADVPYHFTITNFMKPSSLYSHGMRPLMYSEIEASTRQIGWHRIGDQIKYYKNNCGQNGQTHYSLSWVVQFPHSGDTCYFAYCYPYTYSNLQDYLAGIASDPERSKYCKIRVLCHSLAGNIVYVLTITNPSPANARGPKKKAVIVTARVHPGETNSSWVMKGFLDFILSGQNDANQLRDAFVFKVVPMLNPDGVIVGNYRCSLSGRDLNRNYKSRLKDSFPSIWFTRNMIKRVMSEREILLYCDLHGHSRKQNVFMYGCQSKGAQNGGRQLCERIFPFMLSKNSPDKFSFSGCKFKVQRSKEGTGRVVMWKMGIQNSYTLEATFCGSTLGDRRGTHFSTRDLESLGHHFCGALSDYSYPDQPKYVASLRELEETVKQKVHPHLSGDDDTYLDVLSDLDSSTGGSDSSDSNGPPAHLMGVARVVRNRKKQLRSRRERNSQRNRPEITQPQEPPQDNESAQRTEEGSEGQGRPISCETVKTGSMVKQKNTKKGSKRIKAILTKQPRKPLLQDLDTRKVSVIYLMFNASGEVVTTKPHAREQNAMKNLGTLHGHPWSRPLPILRSFLHQKIPFSAIPEPGCYYLIPAGTGDATLSCIPGDGCEIGAGEGRHMPDYLPVSSLYGEGKFSIRSFWAGDAPLERHSGSSLLPLVVPLQPPSMRTSGSAPQSAPAEAPNNKSADSRWRPKEKSSSAPSNREDHGRIGRRKKEKAHLKERKKESSLPPVSNTKEAKVREDKLNLLYPTDTMRHAHHVAPRPLVPSSSTASILLARRGKAPSTNGMLQKRKVGGLMYPPPQDHQAVSPRQPTPLPMNTWKDILIGLEADGGGASQTDMSLYPPFAAKDTLVTQRTEHFVNTTRRPRPRGTLTPLSKQPPNFSEPGHRQMSPS